MKLRLLLFAFLLLPSQSMLFAQRPNIILIMLDDANKSLLPPFAPDYLDVPNIKRIYEEGALFSNCYGIYPLCNPARYSVLTGTYPHTHGAIDNVTLPSNDTLPFFTSILQEAGYHNFCIGKYSNVDDVPPYFERTMCIKNIDYIDPKFTVNGQKKVILGNTSRIINDTLLGWVATVDTPFFAWIGHIAPHGPTRPIDEDLDIYKDEDIPLPSNMEFFQEDYPSFLYADSSNVVTSEGKLEDGIEKALESLLEIDRGLGKLLDSLSERGLLENTMIVFTNDNGTFLGEHMLIGKGRPYEAAMALPLFIRYASWFNTDTAVTYPQFVQSFDLAPTFVEAAGIDPTPYHFDGKSLMKQLSNSKYERKSLFFEKIQGQVLPGEEVGVKHAPSWRAVLNAQFKYVRYNCDSSTEELFDMEIDSLESTNVVNDPAYANALMKMRRLLTSRKLATHDTLTRDTLIGNCHLVGSALSLRHGAGTVPFQVSVYPQPANEVLGISWASLNQSQEMKPATIELINALGSAVERWMVAPAEGLNMSVDVSRLPRGFYILRVSTDEGSIAIPVMLQ